jgi:hypothetical protein
MDQSAKTTVSDAAPEDISTTTEILRAIGDHYAHEAIESSAKQNEWPRMWSSPEKMKKKGAALYPNQRSRDDSSPRRHDTSAHARECPVVGSESKSDDQGRHLEFSLGSQNSHTSLEATAPIGTTTATATDAMNAVHNILPTQLLNNPYASKLGDSYNHRNATAQSSSTDNGNGQLRDSFQAVAPPILRPAHRIGETPGAVAVYPNEPVRQYAATNTNRSSDIASSDCSQDGSLLAVTSSSDIYLADDAAPVIQARLVRDSEILPKDRNPYLASSKNDNREVGESGLLQLSGDASRSHGTSDNVITQAAEVVKEDEIIGRQRKFCSLIRDRRVMAVLLLLGIAIVGLIAGMMALRNNNKDELDGNTQFGNETLFLSPATLAENEDIANEVLGNIPNLSSENSFIAGSPQRVALNWLVNNNVLKGMEQFRILQRFVLASLYFSTGGLTSWTNHTRWLSNDHECSWFQTDFFVEGSQEPVNRCSDDGRITALVLQGNGLFGTIPVGIGLLQDLRKCRIFPQKFENCKAPLLTISACQNIYS